MGPKPLRSLHVALADADAKEPALPAGADGIEWTEVLGIGSEMERAGGLRAEPKGAERLMRQDINGCR